LKTACLKGRGFRPYLQTIKELIAKGNKIAAVKLYREITFVGLREAKDAVEAIERGIPVNIPAHTPVGKPAPGLETEIKRLLAERKKIDAVRVYRETYKVGLKEAKNAIDAIELQTPRETTTSLLSKMSLSSSNDNDPFAEDNQRNRSCLVLVIAILLVGIGGLVIFLLNNNGF